MRFMEAVCIFIIIYTFLCISTENCEGTHFLKGTGKSTAKSALLAREVSHQNDRSCANIWRKIIKFYIHKERGKENQRGIDAYTP